MDDLNMNIDIPVIAELPEPMLIEQVPEDMYKMLSGLCDRIEALGDKQVAMTSNDPEDYALFAVDAFDPNRAISISYHYIEGEGTFIPFFGYYLETKSGVIVRNKVDKIVIGDLINYLKHIYPDFDYNYFMARVEQYYLGNIDSVKDLFTMNVSNIEVDDKKSYLYNLLAYEVTDATERARKVHTMDIKKVLEFMRVCHQINILTSNLYNQMTTYLGSVGVQYYMYDVLKDHPMIKYSYDSDTELKVREFYAELEMLDKGKIAPTVADVDDTFNNYVENMFNQDYPDHEKKISKSERNFFRLLPLIEASQDDEMKCYASLLGEKQEIIESVKSSKFKDVIKGAFLKGVITKKDNILKTLFQENERTTILPIRLQTTKSLVKDFRLACKYLLDISKKICSPRV